LFDGANQFRGTVVADFGRAFHTALANIEKIGGLSLGQVATWRLAPISAVAERRQLGRRHGTLRLRQVPALEIQRNDEANGIVALAGPRRARDARRHAGAIAVAAVENLVLENGDRFVQAVRLDIGDKLVEVGTVDQREDVGERVKFERAHRIIPHRNQKPQPS